MVNSCCAFNCTNRYKKDGEIKFHTFPFHNPDALKIWITSIRRKGWYPTKHSKLCGNHFTPESYKSAAKRFLKDDAVPTIFNFPTQKQNKKRRTVVRHSLPEEVYASGNSGSAPSTSSSKTVISSIPENISPVSSIVTDDVIESISRKSSRLTGSESVIPSISTATSNINVSEDLPVNISKMVISCSVFGCTNRFIKGSGLSFHKFPTNKKKKALWVLALRRKNWKPSPGSVICGKHFQKGKPSSDKNHPDYVPNVFSYSKGKIGSAEQYENRKTRREKRLMATGANQRANQSCEDTVYGLNSQNIISGKPAELLDETKPDLAPSINLRYVFKNTVVHSPRVVNEGSSNINCSSLANSTDTCKSSTNKISLRKDNKSNIKSSIQVKEDYILPDLTMDFNESLQAHNDFKNSPIERKEKHTQTEMTIDHIECLEENNALLLKRILQLEKR